MSNKKKKTSQRVTSSKSRNTRFFNESIQLFPYYHGGIYMADSFVTQIQHPVHGQHHPVPCVHCFGPSIPVIIKPAVILFRRFGISEELLPTYQFRSNLLRMSAPQFFRHLKKELRAMTPYKLLESTSRLFSDFHLRRKLYLCII